MPNVTAVINLVIQGPTISRHLHGRFAEHLGRCLYGGFWSGRTHRYPTKEVSGSTSSRPCAP